MVNTSNASPEHLPCSRKRAEGSSAELYFPLLLFSRTLSFLFEIFSCAVCRTLLSGLIYESQNECAGLDKMVLYIGKTEAFEGRLLCSCTKGIPFCLMGVARKIVTGNGQILTCIIWTESQILCDSCLCIRLSFSHGTVDPWSLGFLCSKLETFTRLHPSRCTKGLAMSAYLVGLRG